ncbi:unnamed protein product [Urochloa humidicola]
MRRCASYHGRSTMIQNVCEGGKYLPLSILGNHVGYVRLDAPLCIVSWQIYNDTTCVRRMKVSASIDTRKSCRYKPLMSNNALQFGSRSIGKAGFAMR